MLMNRGSNVSSWLEADVVRVTPESPLFPRKRTSSAQERFGLKKRTLDVCLTPDTGRKWVAVFLSANDPKRTLMLLGTDLKKRRSWDPVIT